MVNNCARKSQTSLINAHHLKERQISDEAIVEVDIRRVPGVVVERPDYVAVVLGSDDVEAHQFPELITAAAESSTEQVDAHDAEDEPEDEADEQNVEDGWNCLDQRVHYHLRAGQVQLTATGISRMWEKTCNDIYFTVHW